MSDIKSSDAKSPPDLSMDEILTTIRRIISEDEQASSSVSAAGTVGGPRIPGGVTQPGSRAATAADGDVFELTEALNPDGSVRHLAPIGSFSRDTGAVREPPLPAVIVDHEPQPELKPEPEVQRQDPIVSQEPAREGATAGNASAERVLSDVTSAAAAAAFARLAAVPRERREPPMLGDRPLEELVRELLHPLLQTWLDENLPRIVERLVEAEIARVRRSSEPG